MPTNKPADNPFNPSVNPTKAFPKLKPSERECYWDWGVRDSGKSTEYRGKRVTEDGDIRVECTVCGCIARYAEQSDGTPVLLCDVSCPNVAKCRWKEDAGLKIAQIIIDKDAVAPNILAEGCSGGMGGKDDGDVSEKHPPDTLTGIC